MNALYIWFNIYLYIYIYNIIIIMYANLYSAITLQKNYKGAVHKNCHRL